MSQSAPTRHTLQSQRLDIAYLQSGPLDAPPLILVHGGRDQKHSWDRAAQALASTYRVTAYDLRGHGQSDWASDGDYGVMDHVFDLASLMDTVATSQAILIGHSLGGNIALRYSGLYPERVSKLVAIEGLGPSPKMVAQRSARKTEDRLRDWIHKRRELSDRAPRIMADLEAAKTRMRSAFAQLSEAQIHHLTKTGIRTLQDGTVSWAYDPAGMGPSPSDITYTDFQALWAQVTCPTWLVYGADSWASNPASDGRAVLFRNASVSLIEGAGHWLHHDQFAPFMAGLKTFLSRDDN